MADLPKSGAVTLWDIARSLDPNGNTAEVVELLNQTNQVLTDMSWEEGNLPTGNQTTMRTGLPAFIWRKLYKGVPPSKSIRAQVVDACGLLEARSEVDVEAAGINGNTPAFRLSEAQAFLESLNQGFVNTLFYGDTDVNPERFMGLSPRYSDLSAKNAQNIISLGGNQNANCSIWLILWGPRTCSGIFPKGSIAGLSHQDLGEQDAFDEEHNRYRALMDLWKWKPGLKVPDWRTVVRICNIDSAALLADTNGTSIKIIEAMIRAFFRIPAVGMGRPAFYVNRTVSEMLAIQAMNKSQNAVRLIEGVEQFGRPNPGQWTTTFLGVPVRMVDGLSRNEANVA